MRAPAPGSLACLLVVAGAACGAATTPSPSPSPSPAPSAPRELTYAVTMQGQPAGDLAIRIGADGTRTATSTLRVRGAVEIVRTELALDAAGAPRGFRATGKDHFGEPIDEQLAVTTGTLTWQSSAEHGHAPAGTGWYLPLTGSEDVVAALARAVLRAPDHRVRLLPTGEAWLEDDTTRALTIAGAPRRLRRVAIAGLGFDPVLVWLDEQGELFAQVSAWDARIRTGAEPATATLLAADQAWSAARAARLAARLAHRPPAAGLAIITPGCSTASTARSSPTPP
jgi:hypothetical protein